MTQTSDVQGPLRSEMTEMRMRIYAFLASADSHEQLHNPSLRLLSDAMAHLDRLRALAPVVHPGAPPGEFVRDGRYGAVGHVDYRLAGSSSIQWYADCPEPGTQLYIAPPARPGADAPAEAEMFRDLVAAAERAGHTLINKEDNWFALLHRIVWTRTVPAQAGRPLDMVLHCPRCRTQHVDGPEENDEMKPYTDPPTPWTNPPHRTHLCGHCGHTWRPAEVPTNGVASLDAAAKEQAVVADGAEVLTDSERLDWVEANGVSVRHADLWSSERGSWKEWLCEKWVRIDPDDPDSGHEEEFYGRNEQSLRAAIDDAKRYKK